MKDIKDYINKIHNADCLEFMKGMPDKSVDLIVTSPPYNMRLRIRNGEYTEREKSEHFSKKYEKFEDALPIEYYYQFHLNCLKEMLRISDLVFWNVQIVTGSKEAIFQIMGELRRNITDIIIWDKGSGQPAMNRGVLNRGHELILCFESNKTKGRTFEKYEFARGEMQDIWRMGRGGDGSIKGHTALFPIELPSKIINGWTKENDIILDPFIGSGTTAVAAKQLKRRFIGIEISENYCAIARERLRQDILL